ncbi:MAG: alpha/beta hydrolase-fold protein [Bacteroidota bacterium]
MKRLLASMLVVLIFAHCASDVKETEILSLGSGKVERIEAFSSNYVVSRNVDVWLPDNYSEEEEYAVLYMHDGQMLYDSTRSWNGQEWGADETISKLLDEGEIRKTIVVGIWNTELRHSEYFPQKPFESLPESLQDSLIEHGKRNPETALFKTAVCSDHYLTFLVEELKPYIDDNYSTLPDKQNTFIAGSSMGGLISMYAICEYPEIFAGAACLSTHWVGTFDTINNPIPQKFVEYLDDNLPKPESHKIYFDYGTETLDSFYEPYQLLVDSVVQKHGYTFDNWMSMKFENENHSENAWRKRLHIPLTFLLK